MKTVLIINHNIENCGVYQYGKRFASIAKKSINTNFVYLECTDNQQLMNSIQEFKPSIIIYNHLSGTMPWVTKETTDEIRKKKIKQGLIVHNVNYSTFFDFYLHQNPYHSELNEFNYALCRPLFEYASKDKQTKSEEINIGTFGFGFGTKHFDQLCLMVVNQFPQEKVNLNLHLTISHFCPNQNVVQSIKNTCESYVKNTNINLNITNNFITDEQLLNFLYNNDLNVFFYEKYHSYNGISSSIDYALSVKKPIAICKSNMFSHIFDVNPSICVEDNSLKTIMLNGFEPLESKYQEWSHTNFINKLENILEKQFYV